MKRVLALSVVCALMAACDSESDSSTSYSSISDYDYIDFSSDNASSNLSKALRGVGNSGSGEDSGLLGDESASSSTLALAQSIASEYLQSSSRQTRAGTQSGSGSCTDGGTLSIELQGELTASGDWIQAVFSNCLEEGVLTNGGLKIVVTANSILNTDLSVVYQSLSVTESNVTATLNGDLRMAWQRSGTQLTSAISSSSLNMVSSEVGETVLSDLSILQVSDSADQSTDLEIDYDIASDELEGRVTFETVQALNFTDSNENPSTGILKLSGANGSSVILNADTGDVATALLTIDDGSSVISETVNWSSIADSDLSGLVDL